MLLVADIMFRAVGLAEAGANIAHEIEQAGAHLKVIEQNVDTSSAAGRAFYGMLAVFAAFETDVRRERQLEGIAVSSPAFCARSRYAPTPPPPMPAPRQCTSRPVGGKHRNRLLLSPRGCCCFFSFGALPNRGRQHVL